MQASNNLSEGEGICHADACDLVLYFRDELDRVRSEYQDRIGKISILALESIKCP